jgi:RND family efflux transporter MFP subunit
MTATPTTGALLLCGAALLTLACGGHQPPAAAEPAAVRAALASAERLELGAALELAGTTEAQRSAEVASRVMAVVTAVRAQVGDPVRAGQVLAELDAAASRGQLAQAEGALAQAQAALALAETNHRRFRGLAESDAASALELDLARAQLEHAQGAVRQAEGAVEAAASLAGDTRVLAPFAGWVAARRVQVGDLAAPGRPLFTVESGGSRRLVVNVPESLLGALAPGTRLPVELDARPDLGRVTGTVVEVEPGADPASHSVQVKLDLGALEGLPSGAAGRTWLATAPRPRVAIPAGAVLRQGGLTLVAVRDAQGRAATRAVTLGGELADGRVEVLSGLAGGETVLLGLAAPPALGAPVESLR